MEFISPEVQRYAEMHTSPESENLARLNRETHANVLQPRMLSGHLQGRLLSLISKLMQPACILEIGTYTGYSALCLAEGLKEGGKLITIDVNPELEGMVNRYIKAAGLEGKITTIVGDATNSIRSLNMKFDLVFVDADKENYCRYFDLVIDKMNSGGVLIADNVLWSGKVLNESELLKDKDTAALHAFNEKTQKDERVENILLPIRDGLMVVRKK